MSAAGGSSLAVYNQIIEVPDFDEEEKINQLEEILQTAHKNILTNQNVIRADVTQDLEDRQKYLMTLVVKDLSVLEDVLASFEEAISGLNSFEGIIRETPEKYDVILPSNEAGMVTRLEAEGEEDHVLFLKNHVHVWVIEENISDFIDATKMNVEGSIQEDGIARFDFLRDHENKEHFALVEVFKNGEAPGEHKKTEHYLAWREAVAPWMAKKRSTIKTQATVFPVTELAWDSNLEVLSLGGYDEPSTPSGTN